LVNACGILLVTPPGLFVSPALRLPVHGSRCAALEKFGKSGHGGGVFCKYGVVIHLIGAKHAGLDNDCILI
jgi:hypothetical protein